MMSRLRPLRKNNLAPLLALGLAAGLLAACSSTQVTDMIPAAAGGLPANVPARPATAPQYPAVNDMPKPREVPLTDDEVRRAQLEMTTLRQQQEQRAAEAAQEPPPAPDPPPAKKSATAKPVKKSKDAKPAAELTAKDAAK
jgi:hypothetical protein